MNIPATIDLKPPSPALTLVPVSTYHGKWVLIQPIIPKEGSTPARMKASTNVSTNSQLMGDAGYTPFFIWFCLINTHQTKLTLGSRLSSPHTNGLYGDWRGGGGNREFGVLKNWNCLNVPFFMILTSFIFPNIFHYMLHLYICSCSTCFCISIVSLSV